MPATNTAQTTPASSGTPATVLVPSSSDAPTVGVKHTVISPENKKKWEDTMSMMAWTAPGFRHIMYKLLNAQGNTPSDYVAIQTEDAGIAATDGRNIMVAPSKYYAMSLPERVYVLAHEIVHNVYGDVELLHRCRTTGKVPMNDGSSRPFNNFIMQRSMDYRINALLDESRIGKKPKDTGHHDEKVTSADSVLDIYKRVYDEEQPDEDEEGPGNNPGGFDNLMPPGAGTGQSPAQHQRNPQQWGVEIAAAQTIEQSRAQGKMSASLKRMFKELLEPEVPWIDYIETLINRTVGDGGVDWTQPEPWFGAFDFFVPASTGKGAGWIVCWGDTSGSRSTKEIESNIGELAGIMEAVNPQRLTVLWCDAGIGQVDEVESAADLEAIQYRGVPGGGGTDYQPVLDWIRENGNGALPDLFIGFTDGYVDFPELEHPFPTIWASSTDHTYPFGQVVRVNQIARDV